MRCHLTPTNVAIIKGKQQERTTSGEDLEELEPWRVTDGHGDGTAAVKNGPLVPQHVTHRLTIRSAGLKELQAGTHTDTFTLSFITA